MDTCQWVCKACETPNVKIIDDTKEGHVTLNCGECGHPGELNIRKRVVTQFIGGVASTCATVCMSTEHAPRVARMVGGPLNWTEY